MIVGKKIKLVNILMLVLILLFAGSTLYFYLQASKYDTMTMRLLNDYEDLELAYSKALNDLENVSNKNYGNVKSLKQDLKQKLSRIKEIKATLVENHQKPEEEYVDYDIDELIASEEFGDTIFEEEESESGVVIYEEDGDEVIYSSDDVGEIIYINEELRKQNEEMEKNLETIRRYFEKEKSKNEKLNAAISMVNEQLKKAEEEGKASKEQLEKLHEEKEKIEKKLTESNQIIEKQNDQINVLVETLRKANVDCFFIFEEGDPEKEAKIYLTSEGLSKLYLDYFLDEKPDVHIEFKLNEDLFEAGIEKVDMHLYNSKGIDIYNTQKTITNTDLEIVIEGDIFQIDTYSVTLRNGPEDLIIGGEYKFKISE